MSRLGAQLLLVFCFVTAGLDGAAGGDLILAAEGSSASGSAAPAPTAPQSSAAIAPAADIPAVLASSAENLPGLAEAAVGVPTPPGQAPSLIQRLEGREGDLTVWIVIAVIFFLFGWLGGSIYSRRRERSRRGRLRF